MIMSYSKSLVFSTCLLLMIQLGHAQESKRFITQDDAEKWETLRYSTLSKTGKWGSFSVYRNNDSRQLTITNLSDFSNKVIENAQHIDFSNNERWLAYSLEPDPEKKKELEKAKKPIETKIYLLDLETGDSTLLENTKGIRFSPTGNFAALTMEKEKDDKSAGDRILIMKIEDRTKFYFSNVGSFTWNDKSDLLAFTISNSNKVGNGLQLFDPSNGQIRTLTTEQAEFTSPKWREDSKDLLVAKKVELDSLEETSFDILVWNDLGLKSEASKSLEATDIYSLAHEHFITTAGSISWSDDGENIYMDIYPNKKKSELQTEEAPDFFKSDEAPELEIWHSDVDKVITQQKLSSQKSESEPFKITWEIASDQLYQLENDLVENILLRTSDHLFIGQDNTPFAEEARYGRGLSDIYIIDLKGQRSLVDQGVSATFNINPTNTHFVYVKEGDLYLYDIKAKRSILLDLPNEALFLNTEDDHPTHAYRAFGLAAWSNDGKTALIHSKYDIWSLNTSSGQLTKQTNGKTENLIYRVVTLDYSNPNFDPKDEILVRVSHELSKDTGFGLLKLNKGYESIAFESRNIFSFSKADEGDRFIYVKSSFDESANRYFRNNYRDAEVQVTNTNIQQKEFYWTKAELISYTNYAGKELQAILYYPANYKAGTQYPMITYIYEKLTSGYHRYEYPSISDYYNTNLFTQNGYFVLKPDIEFRATDPGRSSARSLEAVVSEVIKMGMVDATRVGLIGHSWGGYQANFVPTETDIFAASVAGAGLTNLISMYGAISPAFRGAPESGHFEVSQERMVQPPYEIPQAYLDNSAVVNVEKLNTPILMEVGRDDTNVNMRQSMEYYNVGRRAGKEMVLLIYEKEGHGLRNRNNQIDYHNRIMQWFGHYLKNETAPRWIVEAQSYAEQQRLLKNWDKVNSKENKESDNKDK